jgi:hypothetical protein
MYALAFFTNNLISKINSDACLFIVLLNYEEGPRRHISSKKTCGIFELYIDRTVYILIDI